MIKVTIGVPVYNAEKFIKEGLDSFVKQTMDKNEFEVLLVDDCSTDKSIEVIQTYADKLNMRVIKLPKNSGGPGEPRNKIIEEAKGEYIFFVDSDDFINEKSLENMYTFAKENDSDVLLVKMKGVNGRGVPQSMFKSTEAKVDLYESRLIFTLSPTKMFKTALLRNHNIIFPVGLKAAEDQIFTMKAYLKANVISVLSDLPYYYATLREGEHMNNAYVDPKEFLGIMSNILDEIYATSEEESRKNELAASFLDRHFNFSRTKNFSIKKTSEEAKIEWMNELSRFLNNHVPKSVDSMTPIDVMARITLARNQDLENYRQLEQALKENNLTTVIEDGEIYVEMDCLKDYPEISKMNITKLNKLSHTLSNVNIGNDRISFTCQVQHTRLSKEQNSIQQVQAVMVHRESKEEKYFAPIVLQPNDGSFTFEIPYAGLLISKGDIGTWDLFVESKVEDYVLRGRVGNKREEYSYKAETSFIGHNHLFSYRLTPYFTKPYDNFSIYIKKLEELEKKIGYRYNKKAKSLELKYPGNHLILPLNSVFTFKRGMQKVMSSPSYILWEEDGTKIVFESHSLLKMRSFLFIKPGVILLNGLPVKLK